MDGAVKKWIVLSFLAISFCARAQISLGPHTAAGYSTGTGTTPVTTSAINTTGQNFIGICATGSSGNETAPTDSQNNVWLKANTQNEDGDSQVTLWYVIGPTTSALHTFTMSGQAPALAVFTASGVASGPDQQSSTQGSSPQSSGGMTPTNANELIASCTSWYPTASSVSIALPMTILDTVAYDGGYNGSLGTGSAYEIQTTVTAVNPTWTTGATNLAIVSDTFYSALSPAPLVITTAHLPEGFVSTAYGSTSSLYSNQLQASGGVGPYSWTITSGTLPTPLSMSSGGLITGTPTGASGPTNITFKVTDTQSSPVNVTLPITIASSAFSGTAGTCTGSALNGTQNSVYGGCSLSGTGGTSPYTFAYAGTLYYSSIPPGLSLNTSTGALSGTDYGEGRYVTPFTVSDSLGTYASLNLTFNLAGNNTLGGCSLFPSNAIFHQRVDSLPVDTSPAAPIPSAYTASKINLGFGAGTSGLGYTPNGIPMLTVPSSASQTITTTWPGYGSPNMFPPNSITSPCFTTSTSTCTATGPIPLYNPVEDTAGYNGSGQDQHTVTVVETGGGHNCQLAEQYQGYVSSGQWYDTSGAFWNDLTTNQMPLQGNGSTTDAAGLPLAPVLENYDEVANAISMGTVPAHPIRFTLNHTLNLYVWPATARAGIGSCSTASGYWDSGGQLSQANPPSSCTFSGPDGEIYRITAAAYASPPNACLTNTSTNPEASVIFQQMREYGIILADNGTTGQIIGTPDSRWNDTDLSCLTNIPLSDFEPVNVSSLIPSANLPAGCPGTNGDCETLSSYQATQPTTGTQLSGVASGVIQ